MSKYSEKKERKAKEAARIAELEQKETSFVGMLKSIAEDLSGTAKQDAFYSDAKEAVKNIHKAIRLVDEIEADFQKHRGLSGKARGECSSLLGLLHSAGNKLNAVKVRILQIKSERKEGTL